MSLFTLFRKLKNIIKNLVRPHSLEPDLARRELILNILILSSLLIFTIINAIRIYDIISNPLDRGLPFLATFLILLFFIFLLFLSKKKKIKLASWLLIIIYFIPAVYCFITWGADLPAALILTILIIALCGVLLNAFSAFFSALFINIFLIILTWLQQNNIISSNNYWRLEPHEVADALVYTILIMTITTIVYIFDRQLRNALSSLQISEKNLKHEKDFLEKRVAERTKEIQEMEAEKISQLYRLAEFGRISSGIFHDLINPLTAISLNLEQMQCQGNIHLSGTKACLNQAIIASNKMEDLINSIKKSINKENEKKAFSPIVEIKNVINLLNYQALKIGVNIKIKSEANIFIYGDALKFHQIISNLVINSLDACKELDTKRTKIISINIKRDCNFVIIRVSDNGSGISLNNLPKIFDSFFSTKKTQGLGLGLSSSKSLLEKDFQGSIEAYSDPGKITIFIIKIPIYKPCDKPCCKK